MMRFACFTSLLIILILCIFACSDQPQSVYKEQYRPQYHFTPAVNWMNDPNGLVFFEDEYHLFYQYNPFGNKWGHMSWGHAVSPDLLHWRHLPVALPETDSIMIFSGSAVVDWNNTSNFGKNDSPPLVAIFTGHHQVRPNQAQYIAYSNDKGRTWTMYEGNPVIDLGLKDFRDPKVVWYKPEKKWVMIVSLPDKRQVRFYESRDLKNWTHLSDFGPAGAVAGGWECPDIFELPIENNKKQTRWILQVDLNPGAIAGGSGGQYFIGHFDGTQFIADDEKTRWIDYGKDFYASVSFSDIPASDGRRILIGWMNNWQYAQDIPTSPWRSSQSIPRELSLLVENNIVNLIQKPVSELKTIRTVYRHIEDITIADESILLKDKGIFGSTSEIIADFEFMNAKEFGLKVFTKENQETIIGYNTKTSEVFIDRSQSGDISFHPEFAGRHSGPLPTRAGRVKLHIFLDWSSVEVFAGEGHVVITDQIFPAAKSEDISLYSLGGRARLISLDAWHLNSVW